MWSGCSRTWRGSAGTTGAAAMTDAPRLVVNADDFGLSAGVNRGILETDAAGVVSSVTVLVNAPGWDDAVRRLRDLGPPTGLGVGLHLNPTMGRPVSWGGSRSLPARLLAVLDRLEPGTTELMVHPGYADDDLAAWDDFTAPRARVLAALTLPEVRERFRGGRFRLIHFGAL